MANLLLENIPEAVAKGLIEAYPDKAEREEKILSLLTQFIKHKQMSRLSKHTVTFDETRTLTAAELLQEVGVHGENNEYIII